MKSNSSRIFDRLPRRKRVFGNPINIHSRRPSFCPLGIPSNFQFQFDSSLSSRFVNSSSSRLADLCLAIKPLQLHLYHQKLDNFVVNDIHCSVACRKSRLINLVMPNKIAEFYLTLGRKFIGQQLKTILYIFLPRL